MFYRIPCWRISSEYFSFCIFALSCSKIGSVPYSSSIWLVRRRISNLIHVVFRYCNFLYHGLVDLVSLFGQLFAFTDLFFCLISLYSEEHLLFLRYASLLNIDLNWPGFDVILYFFRINFQINFSGTIFIRDRFSAVVLFLPGCGLWKNWICIT